MRAVVEFHANRDSQNRFIINEFIVYSNFCVAQFLFKAPFSISLLNSKALRTLRWLKQYFHKIDWNKNGLTFRKDFVNSILSQFSIVYTKGDEKREFLSKFHTNVIDLKDAPTVPADYMCNYKCILSQHDCYSICALRNACFYFEYLQSVDEWSECGSLAQPNSS